MIWTGLRVIGAIPLAAALAGVVLAVQVMGLSVVDQFAQGPEGPGTADPTFFPTVILGAVHFGAGIATIAGLVFMIYMAFLAVPIWLLMDRLGLRSRRAFAAVGGLTAPIGSIIVSALLREASVEAVIAAFLGPGVVTVLPLVLPGAAAGLVLWWAAYGLSRVKLPLAPPA